MTEKTSNEDLHNAVKKILSNNYSVDKKNPEIITTPELDVATSGSAGHELIALNDIDIEEGLYKIIETGVTVKMPSDTVFMIKPKSGHAAKYGIDVLAGVVDSDYTGTIKVILINHGSQVFRIKKGMSIAQGLFLKYQHADNANIVKEDSFNHSGFGSTSQ